MPDEEKVRTKRRKLDSIITKLHKTTPLGKERLGDEENQKEEAKENVTADGKTESILGSSRRKLHRAVKQKQTSKASDDEEEPQGTHHGTEMDGETHATENGMGVEDEQEVHCNGEGGASNDVESEFVPVVKKEQGENYENSLEGLQKMLGFDISEEVEKQKDEGTNKKKKLLSESSDADAKKSPVPVSERVSPSKESEPSTVMIADDLYQQFVAEQKTRELQLDADRAAKRAKLQDEQSDTEEAQFKNSSGAKWPANVRAELLDVSALRRQLEAKTEECEHLSSKLIQMESEMRVQKELSTMISGLQESLTAIEHKMTSSFTRIEQRLDSLEKRPVTTADTACKSPDPADHDNENEPPTLHNLPLTPLNASNLSTTDTSTPRATPYEEESCSPAVQVDVHTPTEQQPSPSTPIRVDEELINNCVKPKKKRGVQEVLQQEKDPHKCAMKLLPYFFTKQELANSNTEGTHNKTPLDSTRLNSLKTLVFTQFPITSNKEKDKMWRTIKGKINSKCRACTYAVTHFS